MNSGLILTAIVATVGAIKIKLIEELIKKVAPADQKAKGHAILLLFFVVVVLTAISLSFDEPTKTNQAVVADEPKMEASIRKSDLEVKIGAVKDGITVVENLVDQGLENKRIKDSIFISNRQERWVYQIGDWTNDDEKILNMHSQLSDNENIKVLKQKRKYLLIKEDFRPKEELQASLEQLRTELSGLSVSIIDLNSFLTRRKDNFVIKSERFREKKKRIELECLVAE